MIYYLENKESHTKDNGLNHSHWTNLSEAFESVVPLNIASSLEQAKELLAVAVKSLQCQFDEDANKAGGTPQNAAEFIRIAEEDGEVSIAGFKAFAVTHSSFELEHYCKRLAQDLNVDLEALGDDISCHYSNLGMTIYWDGHDEYGFNSDAVLQDDIDEIKLELAPAFGKTEDLSQKLHDSAECGESGFYDGGIIFVDLRPLGINSSERVDELKSKFGLFPPTDQSVDDFVAHILASVSEKNYYKQYGEAALLADLSWGWRVELFKQTKLPPIVAKHMLDKQTCADLKFTKASSWLDELEKMAEDQA